MTSTGRFCFQSVAALSLCAAVLFAAGAGGDASPGSSDSPPPTAADRPDAARVPVVRLDQLPPMTEREKADAAARAAVLKKLEKRMDFKYDGARLRDVLDTFAKAAGVSLYVNWPELNTAGINAGTVITMDLRGIAADRGLELVLKQVSADALEGIGHDVRPGYVCITTDEELRGNVVARVYDVDRIQRYIFAGDMYAGVSGARVGPSMPLAVALRRPCTPEAMIAHLDARIAAWEEHLKLCEGNTDQQVLSATVRDEIEKLRDRRKRICDLRDEDMQLTLARECFIETRGRIDLTDPPGTVHARLRQWQTRLDAAWLEAINAVTERIADAENHHPATTETWREYREELRRGRAAQAGVFAGWRSMLLAIHDEEGASSQRAASGRGAFDLDREINSDVGGPDSPADGRSTGRSQASDSEGYFCSWVVYPEEQLVHLIKETCGRSEDWLSLGGPSDARMIGPGLLVVTATADTHAKVEHLLAQLDTLIANASRRNQRPAALRELLKLRKEPQPREEGDGKE